MPQPPATNSKDAIKNKFGQFRTFIGQIAQINKLIAISNCPVGSKSQPKPATTASSDDDYRSKSIREKAGRRFRVLIMGRANAGKTTILQKVCNTAEQPEIFNSQGNKVRSALQKISMELMMLTNY
jgi:polynucleotide 5'-kinase involved in rRNA processing